MAKKSYNKTNHDNQIKTWNKLLTKFKPYSTFDVKDYYGVSLIKLKHNGAYSIKLIHDYTSRSLTSTAYVVEDFTKAMKIISILEWFAKDDHLRPEVDEDDIDLDELDKSDNKHSNENNEEIDF